MKYYIQKEDIILLYIGYHSIPKYNTTRMGLGFRTSGFRAEGLGFRAFHCFHIGMLLATCRLIVLVGLMSVKAEKLPYYL